MPALIFLLLVCLQLSAEDVAIEKKIGQMILVGFRGYEIKDSDWIAQQIKNGELGGVILYDYDVENKKFDRNIKSPDQVKRLCQSLQKYAATPLFIAIDQEGGVVNRFKPEYGFPETYSAKFLGQKNDIEFTKQQGTKVGEVLSDVGVNVNFAPVVDLNLNPDSPAIGKKERSYSPDPNVVVAHARAMIQGHHKNHVLTAVKHFPGHGSATGDTHEGFVDVTNTWEKDELIPYRDLISSGDVDMIMTAHVYNNKLDSKLPASLSKAVMIGILRDQLKFDGVVITDDLQMGAIRNYYSLEDAIKLALDAGVDILQFSNQQVYDPQIAPKAIAIIKGLVATGAVSLDRIELSYRRILQAKKTTRT